MPSGTVEGELLVAIMFTDGGGETLGAPADWTPITGNTGGGHTSRSWYKIAGASEAGPYTFTVSSTEEIVIGILRISGADPSNPIHTKSSTNTGTSNSPDALALTTTVADTLILRYFGADDNDITQDSGYPSSHTGVYVRASTGSGNGKTSSGVAYTAQAGIGTTGTAAFTLTASNEDWSTLTIAIKGPATALYRSVGTDGSDLNASGPTVTITNNTATFASAMPDTIGVGDAITYNSQLAFIHGRTDNQTFTVQDKDGNAPAPAASLAAEVRRAYTSLGNWETQTQNPGITEPTTGDVNPPKDLTANDFVLQVAAYADGADTDGSQVTIDSGWVTGLSTYIRIYTPVSTSEVGVSQRHTGVAGTGYVRRPSNDPTASGYAVLDISTHYVRLEGIEFDGSLLLKADELYGIDITVSGSTDIRIEQCLIHDMTTSNEDPTSSHYAYGIRAKTGVGDPDLVKIANTIIYGINNINAHTAAGARGIALNNTGSGDTYIYNNTLFDITVLPAAGSARGMRLGGGSLTHNVTNNYVGQVTGGDGFTPAAFKSADGATVNSDNNVSFDATATFGSGSGNVINKADYANYFVNVTAGSEDLHLKADSNTLDWGTYGLPLDGDVNLPVTVDIDGETRDGTNPDVGADEVAPGTLYRSVGADGTNLNTGQAVEIVGTTATFSGALPDRIGVGDVLQYGSTNLAFISGRTSATVYTVQSATGGTPVATGAMTPVSLFRAYTSLFNWNAQTENTSIASSVRNFDTSTALTTNNTVMQAAVYKDGVDTDTGPFEITGWTTGPSHYIRVYTPVSTTEVGESQRHTGVAGTGFIMRPSDASAGNREIFRVLENYVRVEGLELDGSDLLSGDSLRGLQIDIGSGSTDIRIESNIITRSLIPTIRLQV